MKKNSCNFTISKGSKFDTDYDFLKEIEEKGLPLYPKILDSGYFGSRVYFTTFKDGCESNPTVDKKDKEFKELSFEFEKLKYKFEAYLNKYFK